MHQCRSRSTSTNLDEAVHMQTKQCICRHTSADLDQLLQMQTNQCICRQSSTDVNNHYRFRSFHHHIIHSFQKHLKNRAEAQMNYTIKSCPKKTNYSIVLDKDLPVPPRNLIQMCNTFQTFLETICHSVDPDHTSHVELDQYW